MSASAIKVLLLPLMLSGCMMVPVDYYRPIDVPFQTLGGPCGGGPKDRVLIEFGEVSFRVSIRGAAQDPVLQVGVDLPGDHRLSVVSDHLMVNGEVLRLAPFKTWDASRSELSDAGPELVGSGEKKFRWVVSDTSVLPRHFQSETPLPGGQSVYEVELPLMRLDGEQIEWPTLTFRKASGIFSTPINC